MFDKERHYPMADTPKMDVVIDGKVVRRSIDHIAMPGGRREPFTHDGEIVMHCLGGPPVIIRRDSR